MVDFSLVIFLDMECTLEEELMAVDRDRERLRHWEGDAGVLSFLKEWFGFAEGEI